MTKSQPIELLAPAKDFEHGKTALDFGADALYIGAPRFSARSAAGNSIVDIENLAKYAHKFNAKVYVALNTILYEKELREAEKLIHQIYEAGADALIIQDFGIFEMNLPPIALHASTQAHNIDAQKINFYEKIGLSRVILARELSLAQIQNIKQNTNIELEAFVHGALCVSYSGQCYMSAYMGNRSGNRGECAQTCRLKYDLLNQNREIIIRDKHLLSLKDMNRSLQISKMIETGISSLKIEGRLKDISYLKNVTAYYRNILDEILNQNINFSKASAGKFKFDFVPDIDISFNRRYTDYFLTGRKPKMNSVSPKSVGKEMGKVISKGNNFIIIDTKHNIINGDGLCFFNTHDELVGFSVNRVEGNKIFTDKVFEIDSETIIYRNSDRNFNKKLESINSARFILINLIFSDTENGFLLQAQTLDNMYDASCILQIEKTPATNPTKALENIKNQLNKTGGTIFNVQNIDINLSNSFFIPISEINNLRRKLLDELYNLLGAKYICVKTGVEKNNFKFISEELSYMSNVSNSLAEKFYKRHGVQKIENAFELLSDKSDKTLMTTKLCVKYNLEMCPKYHKPSDMPEPKYLKLNEEVFKLEFDCEACQMLIKSI